MAQTTYSNSFVSGLAGQQGDAGPARVESFINDEGSAIPCGIGVSLKSEGKVEEIDAISDTLAGIVLNRYARNQSSDLVGADAIENGAVCNVLTHGAARVAVEEAVAPGDPVYVRVTSDGGSNTQLGKFRNDSDSARCKLVKGARFLSSGSASSPPLMFFDASLEAMPGDEVSLVVDHAQVTADTTAKVFKVRADRAFKLERVDYVNPTGLAQDATNFFNIKLQTGAGPTVLANWSTETGQQGTLTADTFVALVLNATPANLILAPGAEVSLFLDESGTATLPAGKLVIHGRYL